MVSIGVRPTAGAIALTILPEMLRFLGQWYLVLYGLGVIAVIVLTPGGLASLTAMISSYSEASHASG